MEEFKQIPNCPLYDISNLGNVRSRRYSKPRILKPRPHVQGYALVRVYDENGAWFDRTIHSLVAEAFLGVCPDGMCVRHLDGDPSNNALSNLAYGTLSDNQQDRIAHGTYGMKLNVRKVKVIRGLHKCGFKIKRIAEIFGINRLNVRRILRYQAWANVH